MRTFQNPFPQAPGSGMIQPTKEGSDLLIETTMPGVLRGPVRITPILIHPLTCPQKPPTLDQPEEIKVPQRRVR